MPKIEAQTSPKNTSELKNAVTASQKKKAAKRQTKPIYVTHV